MNSLSMSPGQNLDGYIAAVRQFEVLSVEEERALAERFFYDEDLDAARELVLRHLCLLYTSPSPRDRTRSRMPSSA